MIISMARQERPGKEELKKELKTQRENLAKAQLKIKDAKLPVMVIFEGWGAAGKGSVLGKVIRDIDPRFFRAVNMKQRTPGETREPFLYRYFVQIPEAGKFRFFDTYYMEEVTDGVLSGTYSKETYAERIHSINICERQLVDNGYLVLKFFFQISKDEQKKRLKELQDDKNTAWRVNEDDLWENKHYEECLKVYDQYLEDTNSPAAPWYVIDAKDGKWALLQVLNYLNLGLETALRNKAVAAPIRQNPFRLEPIPKLSQIPLDKTIGDAKYKKELHELQARLHELHYELYRKKIPVIIAYEGWDAAGKGGNIKRIAGALDPRGYVVEPIASPEPHEKARHFLWRFVTRLPKTGHITIFDRTWYGRVMVERLEGFCSTNDWQRAYNEINEFEYGLHKWGAVIIKFWVQIDKDTQLKRFEDRENTPEKRWKITDEDWRNRDKWDAYETAVNEMLKKTNTDFASWHVLESNDKHYARIKALKIVTHELEKACRSVK